MKIIKVESCAMCIPYYQCGSFSVTDDGDYENEQSPACTHPQFRYRAIENVTIVQGWCPLEDAPPEEK